MAEQAVNQIYKENSHPPCRTETIALTGCAFDIENQWQRMRTETIEKARSAGFPANATNRLLDYFGSNAQIILRHAVDLKSKDADRPLLRAEVQYTIDEEMVRTVEDFTVRRTSRVYSHTMELNDDLPIISDQIAKNAI